MARLAASCFADDVTWEGGWPRLAGHIESATAEDRAMTEVLEGDTLPPQWVPEGRFPLRCRAPRGRRLTGDRGRRRPRFLCRRQEHLYARVRARLSVQGIAAALVGPPSAVSDEPSPTGLETGGLSCAPTPGTPSNSS